MPEGNGFIMDDNPGETCSESKRVFPKIDFSSFMLSLYSSVLVQLGKVEDPATGQKCQHLDLAKHSIDIIAMLEEKTRGNLDTDEEHLIMTLLSEARIAYVEAKG